MQNTAKFGAPERSPLYQPSIVAGGDVRTLRSVGLQARAATMACGGMSAPLSGYQRSSSKAFVPLG